MRVNGIASKEQRVAETSRVLCEAMAGVGILPCRRSGPATQRNNPQNPFFSFIYHSICVATPAGPLLPFFGLVLSPMIASGAMTFSSVSVILNALRLGKLGLYQRA